MITCKDILKLNLDGVELIAGEKGLDRVVSWTYLCQTRPYADHMSRGNFALIVVDFVRFDMEELVAAAHELYELGISGLGVSVMEEREKLPSELIEWADEINLPLFYVRWEGASFVDIDQSIGKILLADEIKVKKTGDYLYNLLFGYDINQRYVEKISAQFNLDFSKDVLFLADQGFRQISVEPVVCDPSLEYAIQDEDIEKLSHEYDILAAEMKERIGKENEFNFYHFMIDLEGGPCVYKRLSGCGAGSEYLSVTPDGSLYPCHQFAGEEEFLLGNVKTGIDEKKLSLIDRFRSLNVYTKKECSSCFCRYYCSGGCAANAYHANHDISLPYETGCVLQRKRVECAIMLKAAKCGL